jgi:hypothetical protein
MLPLSLDPLHVGSVQLNRIPKSEQWAAQLGFLGAGIDDTRRVLQGLQGQVSGGGGYLPPQRFVGGSGHVQQGIHRRTSFQRQIHCSQRSWVRSE